MFKIELQYNKGHKWAKTDDIFFKGYFFDEKNNLYQTKGSIKKYFSSCDSGKIFREKLKKMNGNFVVIIENKNELLVAVDQFRSIPLFYSLKNNIFYITDNAYWLKEKLLLKKIDPFSEQEFLSARYVSGKETLFKEIKQIQAGEYLVATQKDNKIELKKEIYYRYLHKNFTQKTKDELFQELDKISKNIFKRLIKSIDNNATIVIPLSGGYDSRYIATILKKLNYKNVICFSYGKKNNKEAIISQKVAKELGHKWFFVKYTPEKWFDWFSSEERLKYQRFAENLVSLMHIQDFLAVKELKNKKLIPKNSVFVPGHSGDMLGGSHTPKNININKKYKINDVLKHLIEKHYLQNNNLNKEMLFKKIKNSFPKIDENKLSVEQFVNLTDLWNVSNRQTKFIINSVRVYEFFKYQWRIPFWDIELVNFWLKIPLKYRIKKELYIEHLMRLFKEYNIDFRKNISANSNLVLQIKQFIKKSLPNKFVNVYRIKQDYLRALEGLKLFFKENNLNIKDILGKKFNSYITKLQIMNIKQHDTGFKDKKI